MRQHPFYGFPVAGIWNAQIDFFFKSQIRYFGPKCVFVSSEIRFASRNIGFSLVFDYIYRCAHLSIDAAASINRWPHLFIDAAASIHRWPHLFIDAAIYKIDFLKFNLLSNGLIEKFWDALWLGIGPFLCLSLLHI